MSIVFTALKKIPGITEDEAHEVASKLGKLDEIPNKADKNELATKVDKSEIINKADKGEVATKVDITELKTSTKADISELKAATKLDLEKLETRLIAEMYRIYNRTNYWVLGVGIAMIITLFLK